MSDRSANIRQQMLFVALLSSNLDLLQKLNVGQECECPTAEEEFGSPDQRRAENSTGAGDADIGHSAAGHLRAAGMRI